MILRTAAGYTLSIGEGMERDGIYKVLSIKDGSNHYSVEELPGFYGLGRDYVVMHNRKRLTAERFRDPITAKAWLCNYLVRHVFELPRFDLDTTY